LDVLSRRDTLAELALERQTKNVDESVHPFDLSALQRACIPFFAEIFYLCEIRQASQFY
jgi:hypothetical protein